MLSGATLAGAIITIHYFNKHLSNIKMVLASGIGVFTPFPIFFSFFQNLLAFLLMLVFYFLGIVLQIYFTAPEKETGILQRLGYGWNLSKKILYLLALGGLITGILITAASMEQRQEQFKGSLINMSRSQIEAMDIEEMLEGELQQDLGTSNITMSKEEFKNQLLIPGIKQFNRPMNYSTWQSLTESQKGVIVNSSYQQYKDRMQGGVDLGNVSSVIEGQMEEMQEKITDQVMQGMFEQVPIFRVMLKLLPILTGIIIGSFILLYGTLFVSPLCALIELIIPTKEQGKNNKEDKDNEKNKERKKKTKTTKETKNSKEKEEDEKEKERKEATDEITKRFTGD